MRSGLALVGALLLLLSAMALKGAWLTLPAPPATPSADRFDANRAFARLQRILGDQRPHPADSDADDAVRDRLIAEMRAVGLQPRVTDDFACNSDRHRRGVACARVRNLVATIGPAQGRHVLLVAHYDSNFSGPGAADDGIGVASLLETAALLRGRHLARPVSFLINEGEELGLLGARAFVARDPLAGQVESVLNFEARGVTGPAAMFETSRPNGAAIAHFARAVDRPLANSLTTDLYRLIPNDTDVTVFAERPWTILNFAIIGNETRYHSAGDNLAALDRRSLQHMGDQALAMAVELANGAPVEATGERIYADFLGRQLVTLPLMFGLVLLALLLVFFAVAAFRRQALGRPLLAMAAAMLGAAALAWLGQLVVGLLRAGDYWRGTPAIIQTAVDASALAAALLALVLIAGGVDRTRLRAAWWLLFMVCGAALALIAPGGAIYFLLPPLVMAIGMALERFVRGAERVAAVIAALLLFLTFGPPLRLFEELLSNGPHWIFAPLAAAILLPAIVELRPIIAAAPLRVVLAAAGGLFVLAWAAVAVTPAYSDERRQLFVIDYVRDADTGAGVWAVNNDGAPVPFAADWQRRTLPYSQRPRWTARAPSLGISAPVVDVMATEPLPDGRRVRLRLHSSGAHSISLIAPADASLRAVQSGVFLARFGTGAPTDKYVFRCVGRSCDGATFDLVIRNRAPVEFTVVGSRPGLPPEAAALVRARPALARPQYVPDSTITLASMRL